MSAKKHVKAAVVNLEAMIAKRYMQLPTSHSPMPTKYHPIGDVSNKINARWLQTYKELIGEIRWAVEIGQVEISLEVALISSLLVFPLSGDV